MRLLPLSLALLALTSLPVFAQDEKPTKSDAPAAEKEQPAEEVEDAKPKVNWAEVESTGTISSGKQGALDKTLWKGQKRSQIEYLTAQLPNDPHLRSVTSLQRRLLLSSTDFSQVVNDIGPLRGNDYLIQRISKLVDMGLYDDAWELYTQKAEEPYDVSIAQQGMLLMVMRNDLATACLEEKVFATKFPKDAFFAALDKACSKTLGASGNPTFADSKVLNAIYNEPGYNVSAKSTDALVKMNGLERSLVLANGKITYDGLSKEIVAKTPPSLIGLFLLDKNMPEEARAMVVADARSRGIAQYMTSVVKDDQFKKIKDIKDAEARWPYLELVIMDATRKPADLKPVVNYIAEAEPKQLSTDLVIKVLNILLANNRELSTFWLEAAQKQAEQKPIISIYLQAFKSLTPTKIPSLERAEVTKALLRLKQPDSDQIIAIIDSLDKEAEYAKDLLSAYEKHLGLTLEGNYVMPSVGLNILLETAPDQKQSGITVLAVLNSLAANPDNMYSGSVRKVLYSMLNVGLLEDAKTIGSEIVASVLNKY